MKRIIAALGAILMVAAMALGQAPAAKAGDGQIAAGVAGGLLGGMLLGDALASRPPPPVVLYAPPPPPETVYVEESPCRTVRERFWDGYEWRYRPVEVCD